MRALAISALCLCLAACDQGDGPGAVISPTPTPTPTPAVNQPPVFTAPSMIYVPENTSGTIYTFQATDPEGSSVTFTLSGGEDQAFFNLTAGGQLSFKAPPDYETPADSNTNNNYSIEVTASDGAATTKVAFAVLVEDIKPVGYVVAFASQPRTGTDRVTNVVTGPLALSEDSGRVQVLSSNYLDTRSGIVANLSTTDERGLLGWVTVITRPTHPGSSYSGYYIGLSTETNGDIVIAWYAYRSIDRDGIKRIPSLPEIWRIPNTATRNLAGELALGSDGFIYIALGDATVQANAQNPASPFGKILRIDPYRDDFPADPNRNFGVPASGMVAALGLRAPQGIHFDPDGNLIFADRGASVSEEINILRPNEAAVNFGWPFFEGTTPVATSGPATLRAPALVMPHGAGPRESSVIVGGVTYRGAVPALQGYYMFGDVRGAAWLISRATLLTGNATPADLITTDELFRTTIGPLTSLESFGDTYNPTLVDQEGRVFSLGPTAQ